MSEKYTINNDQVSMKTFNEYIDLELQCKELKYQLQVATNIINSMKEYKYDEYLTKQMNNYLEQTKDIQ